MEDYRVKYISCIVSDLSSIRSCLNDLLVHLDNKEFDKVDSLCIMNAVNGLSIIDSILNDLFNFQ